MSDTKATFTVETPGFVGEEFFGAFRRKMAEQLRRDLGEYQSVTVTLTVEVTDPNAPPPVVPPSAAEVALAEQQARIDALAGAMDFFKAHRR